MNKKRWFINPIGENSVETDKIVCRRLEEGADAAVQRGLTTEVGPCDCIEVPDFAFVQALEGMKEDQGLTYRVFVQTEEGGPFRLLSYEKLPLSEEDAMRMLSGISAGSGVRLAAEGRRVNIPNELPPGVTRGMPRLESDGVRKRRAAVKRVDVMGKLR